MDACGSHSTAFEACKALMDFGLSNAAGHQCHSHLQVTGARHQVLGSITLERRLSPSERFLSLLVGIAIRQPGAEGFLDGFSRMVGSF